MALTFPTLPSTGDTYTIGGQLYIYDSVESTWTARNTAKYTRSVSPPSNPVEGDEWLNTNNGILYKRVSDGVDSVWLDISGTGVIAADSDIVKAPLGALPALDGSALTNLPASGSYTLLDSVTISTGVASIEFTGLSTSTFDKYKLEISSMKTDRQYGADLYIEFGDDTAYSSAGYVFALCKLKVNSVASWNAVSTNNSKGKIIDSISWEGTSLQLDVTSGNSTAYGIHYSARGVGYSGGAASFMSFTSGGSLKGAALNLTKMKLSTSSGLLASGVIKLYKLNS